MVRKLKFHEQKLLKKVDFINWKVDNNHRDVAVMRKYCIQKREHFVLYCKLAKEIRAIASAIKLIDKNDPFRTQSSANLVLKLYSMGLIPGKELEQAVKVQGESFCKRRLPVMMLKLKMAQNVRNATALVEQGHVRVGPELVTDPAFIVPRGMEDFVTWVDASAIRKHVLKYNEAYDDFDFA